MGSSVGGGGGDDGGADGGSARSAHIILFTDQDRHCNAIGLTILQQFIIYI